MSRVDIGEYHDDFTKRFKEITQEIESPSPETTRLKKKVIVLKNEIESIAHLLPRYQLLSYSDQVQLQLDKIDKLTRPQRRFQFSKSKSSKRVDVPKISELSLDFGNSPVDPLLKNIDNQYFTFNEKTGLITDAKNSIIIAEDASSITFRNIMNSILVIKSKGPVFIFNVTNSIIFVECHQLRIHDSQNTKFLAQIPSDGAIIENCKGLVFNDSIIINDFQYPNGNSPNYESVSYSEDFLKILDLIRKEGAGSLVNLQRYL